MFFNIQQKSCNYTVSRTLHANEAFLTFSDNIFCMTSEHKIILKVASVLKQLEQRFG